MSDLLRRPELSYHTLMQHPQLGPAVDDPAVAEQVEIQAKYSGYIERQQGEIERSRRHQDTPLPSDLDYRQVRGLSAEVQEKLNRFRPSNLAEAARIPGLTPAALGLLLIHLRRGQLHQPA